MNNLSEAMHSQSAICDLQSSIRKIVVFRALFLGDLLMTVPALRALRRRFPEAEVTLIGLPWAEGFVGHMRAYIDRLVLFAGYPGIVEVPAVPAQTARFLTAQRARRYDLAIQMHGDGSVSNGLVAALGARHTLGFARPGDTWLDRSLPFRDDRNETLRWLDLVGAIEAPIDDARVEFPVGPDDEARAAALLDELPLRRGPLVGLHVGAKDPARRWPATRFAALGDALARRYDATLLLTGSEGERALTAEVRGHLTAPALDLTGRTDLGTLAALLGRLDLLVTNDTGASHMAAATQTPSVVLFGPTRPWRFAPLDRARHRVVDALEFALPGADGADALAALPLAPVLARCAEVLAGSMKERAVGAREGL